MWMTSSDWGGRMEVQPITLAVTRPFVREHSALRPWREQITSACFVSLRSLCWMGRSLTRGATPRRTPV